MFRQIFSVIIIWIACSSSAMATATGTIIPASGAFQWEVSTQDSEHFEIHFHIHEGTFLYQEHLHLTASDTSLQFTLPPGSTHIDPMEGSITIYRDELLISVTHSDKAEFEVLLEYQGCADNGFCYPPVQEKIWVTAPTAPKAPKTGFALLFDHSFIWIGLSFFGMGLLLAFTPCVLPMIPILAGILSGEKNLSSRRAFSLSLTYVLAMSVTYALAGILAAHMGHTLQASFQKPWIIFSFALLLLLLALKQMDWLKIPSIDFLSRLDIFFQHKLPQGTYLGAAGLGVLATLIASPCVTAPMVGALTYISQTQDIVLGGFALWMMGLGLGAPLLVLGTLGSQYLPKKGPWMKTIQRLFAFLLLALSAWFMERAYSEYQAQTLPLISVPNASIAAHADKGTILDFDARWCSNCRMLKKTVLPILAAGHDWAVQIVDISDFNTKDQEMMARYKVVAPPTFIFLNKEGIEIGRLVGEEITLGNIEKIE